MDAGHIAVALTVVRSFSLCFIGRCSEAQDKTAQETDLGETTPPAAPAATSYETIVLSSTLCKTWEKGKRELLSPRLQVPTAGHCSPSQLGAHRVPSAADLGGALWQHTHRFVCRPTAASPPFWGWGAQAFPSDPCHAGSAKRHQAEAGLAQALAQLPAHLVGFWMGTATQLAAAEHSDRTDERRRFNASVTLIQLSSSRAWAPLTAGAGLGSCSSPLQGAPVIKPSLSGTLTWQAATVLFHRIIFSGWRITSW